MKLAAEAFSDHLAAMPKDAAAHAYLALCLADLKQYVRAEEEVRVAVELSPSDGFAHRALANVLLIRRQFPEALKCVRGAIDLEPSESRGYALMTRVFLWMGDYDQALRAVEIGLQCDPMSADCSNLRALTLKAMNRSAEAKIEIERSLSINPENPRAHLVHGDILIVKGRAEEALEAFKESLRADPGNEQAREGIVEALRTRFWFFRNLFRFKRWSDRTHLIAKILIFGIALVAITLFTVHFPSLVFIVPIFVSGVFILVLLTWVAEPLSVLCLRFSAYGRLALSRDQILGSNLAALMMVLSFIALLLGAYRGDDFAGSGVIFFLLIMPAYRVFYFEPGRDRTIMTLGFVALALLGGAAATLMMGRHFAPALANIMETPDTLAVAFMAARIGYIALFAHRLRAPR